MRYKKIGKGRVHRRESCKNVNLGREFPGTQKQERCARRNAWDLAKDVYKLKREAKDTFYSPAEAWVMPAPSSKNLEEREFVIDSRASMHMLSKKDLGSGELETLRRSRNPTTVATADGEVQTNARSSSLRACAIARKQSCSSIVWKFLRRARLHL